MMQMQMNKDGDHGGRKPTPLEAADAVRWRQKLPHSSVLWKTWGKETDGSVMGAMCGRGPAVQPKERTKDVGIEVTVGR